MEFAVEQLGLIGNYASQCQYQQMDVPIASAALALHLPALAQQAHRHEPTPRGHGPLPECRYPKVAPAAKSCQELAPIPSGTVALQTDLTMQLQAVEKVLVMMQWHLLPLRWTEHVMREQVHRYPT